MKNLIDKIILWFAFKFRFKDKKYSDTYFNLQKRLIDEATRSINLDIKDIRFIKIKK